MWEMKDFLKAKSKYFFLFFETPHWVGVVVYLLVGMSYGSQPGGSVIEGVIVWIFVIALMFSFWSKQNNSKQKHK